MLASQTVEPVHEVFVHTQAEPVSLQRGWEPLQSVAQQTPVPAPFSTQWLLAHSPGVAVEQAAPFGFVAVQVPPFVA